MGDLLLGYDDPLNDGHYVGDDLLDDDLLEDDGHDDHDRDSDDDGGHYVENVEEDGYVGGYEEDGYDDEEEDRLLGLERKWLRYFWLEEETNKKSVCDQRI